LEDVTVGRLRSDADGRAAGHDWQSWRWEFGEQPGHSPRYAVVHLTDEPSGPAKMADYADAPEARPGTDTRTIALGWFHRYPARFAADALSHVLATAFAKANRPVRTILDPFCGTGSVLAASRQLMRNAIGVELTALGHMIASVRLDPPDPIGGALHNALQLTELKPASRSRVPDELEKWTGTQNACLLTSWLDRVAEISDPRARRFLQIAISQSLRPASRWLAGSVKATADPHRTPRPIEQVLPRFARQLAKDCAVEQASATAVAAVARDAVPYAAVIAGDARRLPLADNTADVLITSPPYFVTYDYFDVQRLTYLAFGWETFRPMQLGARYGHLPNGEHNLDLVPVFGEWYDRFGRESATLGRALRVYGEGFTQHAREARRVIAPGGVVAYSVANSVRQGQLFDLVGAVAQTLTAAGFSAVEARPRPQAGRRILPPGRDISTGRFADNKAGAGIREYVVYGISP
jgi:hypothetical protein